MALVNRDAAFIIEEKDLTGERVAEVIEKCITDPLRSLQISENARKMGVRDAKQKICDIVLQLADKKA